MKKITCFLLIFCFSAALVYGQRAGKIVYERRHYWVNIMSKLPFMTKEAIDREMMSWGKNQGEWKEEYVLYFKDNKSLFQRKPEKENFGYSWKEDTYVVTRDYQLKQTKDLLDFLGKDYLVTGESHRYKWKIQNEIKEIKGYLCMKAETVHPIRNTKVTAWFTDKIPVSMGPEGLGGLPGAILAVEYNDNDLTLEAVSIELLEDVELPYPKKFKGKEISIEEYNSKVAAYITEAIQGRRNPFWQIRY